MRMGRDGRAGSPLPAESASGTSAGAHGVTRPTTSSFERGKKYARVAGNMRKKKKILSHFIFRAMVFEELDSPPGFLTK